MDLCEFLLQLVEIDDAVGRSSKGTWSGSLLDLNVQCANYMVRRIRVFRAWNPKLCVLLFPGIFVVVIK